MEQKQTPWQMFGDPARKRKFAALLRERPDNDNARYEAACLSFPDEADAQLCMKAMHEWPRDPIVIEELARLAKEEDAAALPSRDQQARDVYRLAADQTKSVDDRLKAHKLYADLMGHVQKGDNGAHIFIDNRRVMMMPPAANSMTEWEDQATKHQAGLVIDAASTLANR